MSPPARDSGGSERRLSVRTLAIASIASATAALVVSLFWRGGTPIAAAVTPVIVALVSEMLHRPTAVIAEKLTTERDALPERFGKHLGHDEGKVADKTAIRDLEAVRALREDGPAQRRPIATEQPTASSSQPPAGLSDVSVYGGNGGGKRRLPVKLIAVTALLAFVIGSAILTVPELIAGRSIGHGDRQFSVLGGGKKKSPSVDETTTETQTETTEQPQRTTPEDQESQEQVAPDAQQTAPAPAAPQDENLDPQATETTPTTPTETTPVP